MKLLVIAPKIPIMAEYGNDTNLQITCMVSMMRCGTSTTVVYRYRVTFLKKILLTFMVSLVLSFPEEEIDFYLPQLINMYINMPSVAEVLHPYLVARCR
jgi:hypothetical protein